MILVDTNVWSELMRPSPDERVRAWDRANSGKTWLSTVVIGELLSGVALMQDGQRRRALQQGYEALVAAQADRMAPFDLEAAHHYAHVLAYQIRAGRTPGTADTQIAATALARGMALATRNTRHFEGLALELIDPWSWQG